MSLSVSGPPSDRQHGGPETCLCGRCLKLGSDSQWWFVKQESSPLNPLCFSPLSLLCLSLPRLSARLGRSVIESEHANKANDFPPTLHLDPRGSSLPSPAHTSFTKYVDWPTATTASEVEREWERERLSARCFDQQNDSQSERKKKKMKEERCSDEVQTKIQHHYNNPSGQYSHFWTLRGASCLDRSGKWSLLTHPHSICTPSSCTCII